MPLLNSTCPLMAQLLNKSKSDRISLHYFMLSILEPSADFQFLLSVCSSKSFTQNTTSSNKLKPDDSMVLQCISISRLKIDLKTVFPWNMFGPQQRNIWPGSSWVQHFKCSQWWKKTSQLKFMEQIPLLGVW